MRECKPKETSGKWQLSADSLSTNIPNRFLLLFQTNIYIFHLYSKNNVITNINAILCHPLLKHSVHKVSYLCIIINVRDSESPTMFAFYESVQDINSFGSCVGVHKNYVFSFRNLVITMWLFKSAIAWIKLSWYFHF